MTGIYAQIKQIEEEIEEALWSFEKAGENSQALAAYREAEHRLEALNIQAGDPNCVEYQRVLAFCLLRQGNILRQLGQLQDAMALSEREIAAARKCGDPITLAHSLMSNGTNQIMDGRIEQGMGLLHEARALFEKGDSYDHKQGLGWYWVLQADFINANLIAGGPPEAIEAADRALAILLPIENWLGAARSFAARALSHEHSGNLTAAKSDRTAQREVESKIGPDIVDFTGGA